MNESLNSSLESFPDSFSHLNDFDSKDPFDDSGNYPFVHYKAKINPIRFKIREFLLPFIRSETPILNRFQKYFRNQLLDYYFSYSANLAAHTFYVLMLPLPIWFGYGMITRDLVYILGYGIYFSGYIKDFCCLPRPRSPPLHRITLSGYTAKEYGFPSSHSANATAVSILLLFKILDNLNYFSTTSLIAALSFLFLYYVSLIIGRLYCGMHGFSDILVGSVIGALCYLIRIKSKSFWDDLIIYSNLKGPIISIIFNYSLIYFHVSPVDDCPCFDDSVAFIGVVLGLDITQWLFINSSFNGLKFNNIEVSSIDIPYSYSELGLFKSILRVLLGVIIVVIWKTISKPLLLNIFKFFYKAYYKNEYNSDKFNRIRNKTISRNEKIGDVKQLIKDLSKSSKIETVGPQSSMDLYELQQYEKNIDSLHEKNILFTCGVFKQRYDAEIIVRLIVYAGIPPVVVFGFAFVSERISLNFIPN